MTQATTRPRSWGPLHKDGRIIYFGTARVEWERERVHVFADVSLVDDLNDHERTSTTTEHEAVRYGDVPHVSITWSYGTARELNRGDGSGGAGIDGDVLDALEDLDRRRVARRLVAIADRWHNNTMTPGCVHQGRYWTCTRGRKTDAVGVISEGCGTVNGWPVVGRLPYPQRGDACTECGRNRWDEPTDACPVTGYRYGTAHLLDVPPAEIVAELRAIGADPGDVSA